MNEVEEIFEELNYPSAPRLKRVLQQRGIAFDPKEVDRLAKGESVRQVQAAPPLFKGKIWSSDLNDRWFADLIDFTAAPSDGGAKTSLEATKDNERYILVVQDVFSRRLWARALKSKQAEEVAEAFGDILRDSGEKPRSLTTDGGSEFSNVFKDLVARNDIEIHTKDRYEPNVISTLDIAIGYLKKALVRVARKKSTNDWASILDAVVQGQNKLPNDSYLEGKTPASVPGDPDQIAHLQEKNLDFIKHNEQLRQSRQEKLEDKESFRVVIPKAVHFSRGFKPSWSQEVHKVATVDGHTVTDDRGQTFKTKFTQPIAEATYDAGPVAMESRSSKQTTDKQRLMLQDFADRVVERYRTGTTVPLSVVALFLGRPWKAKLLEARLNMRAPVANFLRLFPDKFLVTSVAGASNVKILNPIIPGRQRLRRMR